MHWKTFACTINAVMFGVSLVILSFNAGMLKENRRIAMVSLPTNCQMVAGTREEIRLAVNREVIRKRR